MDTAVTLKALSRLWKLYPRNTDRNNGEFSAPLLGLNATVALEFASFRNAQNCPHCPRDSDAQDSPISWRSCAALIHNIEFLHNNIKGASRFKFVIGATVTNLHQSLQLIPVVSCFRCRPLPTCLIKKFIHQSQRSASTWNKDFVNVSDRFSLTFCAL